MAKFKLVVLSEGEVQRFSLASGNQIVWFRDNTQGPGTTGIHGPSQLQDDLVCKVVFGGHHSEDDAT